MGEKAAIITYFSPGSNYGQTLQAYAVQKALEKYHITGILINYNPYLGIAVEAAECSESRRRFKGLFQKWIIAKRCPQWRPKRIFKFYHFAKKRLCVSLPCTSQREVEEMITKEGCTALVFGSDQIWNINYQMDAVYYGNFPGLWRLKKIAFAPSLGIRRITREQEEGLTAAVRLIRQFDAISVREHSGKLLLDSFWGEGQERLNRGIEVLLDPVFMLKQKEWSIVEDPVRIKKPYILCYVVGSIKSHWPEIIELKQRKGLDLIIIHMKGEKPLQRTGIEWFHEAGPGEFLFLFGRASYIMTDSFHGLAFSVIYHKECFLMKRRETDIDGYIWDDRIDNLLTVLKLPQKDGRKGLDAPDVSIHDFERIDRIIKREQLRTGKFLEQAFSAHK